MPAVYAAADAFVLPTRGEGWGRPIAGANPLRIVHRFWRAVPVSFAEFGMILAEAMAMGLPVAATNWSGHTLFMNETTAWPVPLDGLSCIDNVAKAKLYARHRWAEPSVCIYTDHPF